MASSKKKELSIVEIIESHKPKNFKYKYLITDDSIYDELIENNYDLDQLDTIQNDELVQEALKADYKEYQSDIIGKAKEPTILDSNNGIIISKKMITKTGKKLLGILIGFFDHNGIHYISIKLRYEKFEILEIFILT